MLGQVGGGNPSQVYRSWVGNANNPIAPTKEDSADVVLGRMNQETADRNRDAQVGQANADRLSQQSRADQDRAVQLQLGMAPINLKRDIFGQVSPLLTGLMSGSNERVGGQSAAAPDINRSPVWTADQIQQQVNAGQSANLAAADTQNRDAATKMAGQGFGTRSPLLAALQGATNMQAQAANTDTDRQTRWGAAQGNADQTYRTDQLATQAWNQAQEQDIARRQMQTTYAGNLASVLAGLV